MCEEKELAKLNSTYRKMKIWPHLSLNFYMISFSCMFLIKNIIAFKRDGRTKKS